jgi:hypothetical protein
LLYKSAFKNHIHIIRDLLQNNETHFKFDLILNNERRKENGILPPGSEVNRLYNKRGHL